MRKQVTRLWRWSRSTVRFADQSISREGTLSRQSRTSGWQRFVGYSMQYSLCFYWTCLWTYNSNLLWYVLLLYSLWAILYSASFWLKMIRRYFFLPHSINLFLKSLKFLWMLNGSERASFEYIWCFLMDLYKHWILLWSFVADIQVLGFCWCGWFWCQGRILHSSCKYHFFLQLCIVPTPPHGVSCI